MYNQKKQTVQLINDQIRSEISRKEQSLNEELKIKSQQRESIRQMALRSKQNVDKVKLGKAEMTKAELKTKTEEEKRLIYKYEKEAQHLEALEEQLIKRLQYIQEDEKLAF